MLYEKRPPDRRAEIYVSRYEQWAKELCAPLFWKDENGSPHNGTITFVRTTSHIIGLTNKHVSDALEKLPLTIRNSVKMGSTCFESHRLIAKHEKLDLASYEISEINLNNSFHKAASVSTWPPSRPEVNDIIVACGYPAIFREDDEVNEDTSFCSIFYAGFTNESSEHNIITHVDIPGSNYLSHESVDPELFLGGVSGGPVFRIVNSTIERAELAGIIHQVHHTSQTLFAHPLTDLSEDGTFAV